MCVDDVDAYECEMISHILGHINASVHVTVSSSTLIFLVVALLCLSVGDMAAAFID